MYTRSLTASWGLQTKVYGHHVPKDDVAPSQPWDRLIAGDATFQNLRETISLSNWMEK